MIARGVSPNASDPHRNQALHVAIESGNVSTVKLLLAKKADIEAATGNEGWTALHIAIMNRQLEPLALLLAAKAKLEARDKRGRTPLHWGPFAYLPVEMHLYQDIGQPHNTVYRDPGRAVAIEMLLDAGANIDARDNAGETALYKAADLGSVRGVEILIERGADASLTTKAGRSPLDEAKRRGDQDVAAMLGNQPQAVSPAEHPTPP